jgi:DNA-binding transcriptional ArsR family regulator
VTVVDDLDPVIHAPKRLAAMAILAGTVSTDFAFLRTHLDVSDSDLSKQMATLEKAGYVTKLGKGAFQRHVSALRAITAGL